MSASAKRLSTDLVVLEQLLRTGQVRRLPVPAAPSGPRPLSTGLEALDQALGGGLARGQLHEIVAGVSAGGTALVRAALAAATAAGELCALVDLADAFDPRTGEAARIDLRRLLWVRPITLPQALRAAEIALEARFGLVALDLWTGRMGAAPFARLARRAERHGNVLLVLSRAAQANAFAATTVELARAPARWEGRRGTPARLLRGALATGKVARARRMPPSGPIPVQLPLSRGGRGEG